MGVRCSRLYPALLWMGRLQIGYVLVNVNGCISTVMRIRDALQRGSLSPVLTSMLRTIGIPDLSCYLPSSLVTFYRWQWLPFTTLPL